MIQDQEWAATATEAGQRLDRVVAQRYPGVARARITDALASGTILLNGRRAAKGLKVARGDRIRIETLTERDDFRAQPDPSLPLVILHEDADILVVDKPAGMPVHPLDPQETGTLVNALLAHDPALGAIGDDPRFPALVHRLDTDTSGVMLAARTPEAYDFLRDAFRNHRVRKTYLALARGAPPASGHLEQVLGHLPSRPGKMAVYDEAPAHTNLRLMRAITDYAVQTRYAGYALLEVTIPTGVTHQIRAQLAAAGHPLAADTLYGGATAIGELGLQRHFLHAALLAFEHPRTLSPLQFSSALPAELTAVLASLPGIAQSNDMP